MWERRTYATEATEGALDSHSASREDSEGGKQNAAPTGTSTSPARQETKTELKESVDA